MRPALYICICNALTESDVRRCVATGACSTRQVKAACGWKSGCGSCTGRLAAAIGDARAEANAQAEAESSAA